MQRIPSLDGLRAISILLVVLGHTVDSAQRHGVMIAYSGVGVRIFFVISGYLITRLLLEEHAKTSTISLRTFYLRRAYRILPAAVVFSVPILIAYRHELGWYEVGAAALYLVNFLPRAPWFIGHLWSLSVEEQFYLLWPSVLKKWYGHRSAILWSIAVAAPCFRLACFAFNIAGGGHEMFPGVADNLAIGCLAAILAPKVPKISAWIGACMVLMVAMVPIFAADTKGRTVLMLFVLWPAAEISIAGILIHVVRRPYKLLNWGPVVWLGQISYSLYLWQQPFFFNPAPKPWYFRGMAWCWLAVPTTWWNALCCEYEIPKRRLGRNRCPLRWLPEALAIQALYITLPLSPLSFSAS